MSENSSTHTSSHANSDPAEGTSAASTAVQAESSLEKEGPSFATVALVGAGVALIEPELIPGMLIGAGAWLAPKLLPALGGALRPLVKGVIKASYSATMAVREMAAEAGEHLEDIVAEAKAEHAAAGNGTPATAHSAGAEHAEKKPVRRPAKGAN